MWHTSGSPTQVMKDTRESVRPRQKKHLFRQKWKQKPQDTESRGSHWATRGQTGLLSSEVHWASFHLYVWARVCLSPQRTADTQWTLVSGAAAMCHSALKSYITLSICQRHGVCCTLVHALHKVWLCLTWTAGIANLAAAFGLINIYKPWKPKSRF